MEKKEETVGCVVMKLTDIQWNFLIAGALGWAYYLKWPAATLIGPLAISALYFCILCHGAICLSMGLFLASDELMDVLKKGVSKSEFWKRSPVKVMLYRMLTYVTSLLLGMLVVSIGWPMSGIAFVISSSSALLLSALTDDQLRASKK